MHIELDVMEIAVLMGVWFTVQWGFRALVMILVAKVISAVMEKGRAQIEQVKTQVSGLGKKQEGEEGN